MTLDASPSWDVMPTTVAPWAVRQSYLGNEMSRKSSWRRDAGANSSPAASQKLSL